AREARGVPQIQWASIAEAHQKISENELSCILVGGIGFEPMKPRGQLVYSQSRLTTSVPTLESLL
ncbi:MAG: hypothetical protein UV47_C0040G0010, partial [Parcubacteria group bacterium GW2011_GWA2_42_80]